MSWLHTLLALAVLAALTGSQEETSPPQEPVPQPPGEAPPAEPATAEPAAQEPSEEAGPEDVQPAEEATDTGEAEVPEWRREWEAELAERAASDFRVADLDRSGWLSLREAESTLDIGRDEYQRFDADTDGRWTPAEFTQRYAAAFARLGSVPAPRVRLRNATDDAPVASSPLEILRTYDTDLDLSLDDVELARLIEHLALDLAAAQVRARVDANGSGRIELDELETVMSLVQQRQRLNLGAASTTAPGDDPLRRMRPLDPLARLDLDDDGGVTRAELERLATGLRLDVRAGTVHAALDADGDGRLTRAELLASMQH